MAGLGGGRVRGTVVGFVRAFDRHMNMVLAEAEETYLMLGSTPRLSASAAARLQDAAGAR